MESKFLLVSFIAVLAAITIASAYVTQLPIDMMVQIDNQYLSNYGYNEATVEAGDTVSVELNFLYFGMEEAHDVEISVFFVEDKDNRVDVKFHDLVQSETGSTQNYKTINLKLPEKVDPQETLTLRVQIDSDQGSFQEQYDVVILRKDYNVDFLFIESDSKVMPGNTLGVDVVIKNMGRHDLEDMIVTARVPELGISRSAYFADLVTDEDSKCYDECYGYYCCNDNDDEDSASGRIFLQVPENAKAGTYTLEVEAKNDDVTEKATRTVVIEESKDKSDVLVPMTGKEITVGEEATFDLVILNAGNKIRVYEIVPETTGLQVSVSESLITVPADSSKTVKVKVVASEEGTYTFGVNVNSEGQLVKRATLSATAKEASIGSSLTGSVTVLTIVLAVVFVVLLIVLIVLLTRKPQKEELGESYY